MCLHTFPESVEHSLQSTRKIQMMLVQYSRNVNNNAHIESVFGCKDKARASLWDPVVEEPGGVASFFPGLSQGHHT